MIEIRPIGKVRSPDGRITYQAYAQIREENTFGTLEEMQEWVNKKTAQYNKLTIFLKAIEDGKTVKIVKQKSKKK